MNAIDTDGLTKRFGDHVAVTDLDLQVGTGQVYGFVGPNGAGKSTTIAMLLDLFRPTSGSARVLDLDAQSDQLRIRRRVGILPERCGLYRRLTGRDHLAFAIDAAGSDETSDALLERVGLGDTGDQPTRTYSTGMAQRLRLAIALVDTPDLLILDEPASGLDPTGLARLRQIVRAERDRGAAVFFSSHSLDQVRAVCDRVGMLVDGTLRADDEIEAFEGTAPRLVLDIGDERAAIRHALGELSTVSGVERRDGDLVVTLTDLAAKTDVIRRADAVGTVADFSVERGSLAGEFERIAEAER